VFYLAQLAGYSLILALGFDNAGYDLASPWVAPWLWALVAAAPLMPWWWCRFREVPGW
jgi:hypothetical protein